MKRGLNSTEMLKRNRILVFKTLIEKGSATRAELASELGLQKATITNIINEFVQMEILTGDGDIPSGKRGEKLSLRIEGRFLISMGITRVGYDIAVYTLDGRLQEWNRYRFGDREAFSGAVKKMTGDVSEIQEKYGSDTILGACLAVPGLYIRDDETGKETYMISEFPQWNDVDIRRELEDALNRKIVIMHDAKLSAYAEWQKAEEVKENSNVSIVAVRSRGFGIGCGMVINGKIVQGQLGIAGEVGHMGINFNTRDPEDGSFEANAGTDSAVKYMCERLIEFPDSPLTENSSYDDILVQYDNRDPLAVWVIEKLARMLAYGLSSMVYLINPDCIIIGSDYPKDHDFIEMVRKNMSKYVPDIVLKNLVLRNTKLREDSFIIGGYYHLMDKLYENDQLLEEVSREYF